MKSENKSNKATAVKCFSPRRVEFSPEKHFLRGNVPTIRTDSCLDILVSSLGASAAECDSMANKIVKAVNEHAALCAVAKIAAEFAATGYAFGDEDKPLLKALADLKALRNGGAQ